VNAPTPVPARATTAANPHLPWPTRNDILFRYNKAELINTLHQHGQPANKRIRKEELQQRALVLFGYEQN